MHTSTLTHISQVQTQIRCQRMWHLIRVSTVRSQNVLLKFKLEDLKVLRRSPDPFYNVKIGQGFTAYNKTYFVLPFMGVAAILVK